MTYQYFKDLSQQEDKRQLFEIEIATYISEVTQKVKFLKKTSKKNTELLQIWQTKKNQYDGIIEDDRYEDDNTMPGYLTIDLREVYEENYVSIIVDGEKIDIHLKILDKIVNQLSIAFPVFKLPTELQFNDELEVFDSLTSKTVFINYRNSKLIDLFDEMIYFLPKNYKIKNFTDIFSSVEIPNEKLNFANGDVKDFAYLFHRLQPYFNEEIKTNYAQWIIERFTFKNGKTLSWKNCANRLSEAGNEGNLDSKNKSKIDKILQNFSNLSE